MDNKRGFTFDFTFTITNPPATEGTLGTPINLTGYTAAMKIKNKAGNTTVCDLTTGNGRIVLGGAAADPTNGQVRLLVPDTDTTLWVVGQYIYDFALISSGGLKYPVLEGPFEVKASVTY